MNQLEPSKSIIEQIQEESKPEQYWWLKDPSNHDTGGKFDGLGTYIAIFRDEKIAMEQFGHISALKVFPANLASIQEAYHSCLSVLGSDIKGPQRRVVGFAFCDSSGNVTEWRRW